MPVAINFKICDNAPECGGIEVCPTGALSYDEEKKSIVIDNSKCISCGACERNCPVEAIKVAKTEEDFKKVQKEFDEDPRKISDLFVDRYGAVPIDPDRILEKDKLDSVTNLDRPVLVEFFNDDSIKCLRKALPFHKLLEGLDILYNKIDVKENFPEGISHLPALVLFKEGKIIGKIEGFFGREKEIELRNLLRDLLKNL